jgi:hypothetical protein
MAEQPAPRGLASLSANCVQPRLKVLQILAGATEKLSRRPAFIEYHIVKPFWGTNLSLVAQSNDPRAPSLKYHSRFHYPSNQMTIELV